MQIRESNLGTPRGAEGTAMAQGGGQVNPMILEPFGGAGENAPLEMVEYA